MTIAAATSKSKTTHTRASRQGSRLPRNPTFIASRDGCADGPPTHSGSLTPPWLLSPRRRFALRTRCPDSYLAGPRLRASSLESCTPLPELPLRLILFAIPRRLARKRRDAALLNEPYPRTPAPFAELITEVLCCPDRLSLR